MIKISRKDMAYEYLYDEIINNRKKPGEYLVESDIANILSISRTPVREALRDLEKDGLVSNFNGRSSMVSYISPTDISDIFDIRISLESLALEKSIYRITSQEIDDLIEKFEYLGDNFKWEDSHKADKQLHELIIKKSGNKKLFYILNNLNSQIERFRRIASRASNRSFKSIKEHLDLLYCLKSQNLDESRQSLIYHLNRVKESLLEISIIDSTENVYI